MVTGSHGTSRAPFKCKGNLVLPIYPPTINSNPRSWIYNSWFTHSLNPRGISIIDNPCTWILNSGNKPENLGETQGNKQRTCKTLYRPGSNQDHQSCEAAMLPTVPFSLMQYIEKFKYERVNLTRGRLNSSLWFDLSRRGTSLWTPVTHIFNDLDNISGNTHGNQTAHSTAFFFFLM